MKMLNQADGGEVEYESFDSLFLAVLYILSSTVLDPIELIRLEAAVSAYNSTTNNSRIRSLLSEANHTTGAALQRNNDSITAVGGGASSLDKENGMTRAADKGGDAEMTSPTAPKTIPIIFQPNAHLAKAVGSTEGGLSKQVATDEDGDTEMAPPASPTASIPPSLEKCKIDFNISRLEEYKKLFGSAFVLKLNCHGKFSSLYEWVEVFRKEMKLYKEDPDKSKLNAEQFGRLQKSGPSPPAGDGTYGVDTAVGADGYGSDAISNDGDARCGGQARTLVQTGVNTVGVDAQQVPFPNGALGQRQQERFEREFARLQEYKKKYGIAYVRSDRAIGEFEGLHLVFQEYRKDMKLFETCSLTRIQYERLKVFGLDEDEPNFEAEQPQSDINSTISTLEEHRKRHGYAFIQRLNCNLDFSLRKQMKLYEEDPKSSLLDANQFQRLKKIGLGCLVKPPTPRPSDKAIVKKFHPEGFEREFARLSRYRKQYGTVFVQKDHATGEFENLYPVFKEYRTMMQSFELNPDKARMTKDQYERLKDLGLDEDEMRKKKNTQEEEFEREFTRLQRYKDIYGTVLVIKGNGTAEFEGLHLTYQEYKKQVNFFEKGSRKSWITKDQYEQLKGLGIDKAESRRKTKHGAYLDNYVKMFQKLKELKEKTGSCDLPTGCDSVSRSFSAWVSRTRVHIKLFQNDPSTSWLNAEQVKELLDLGFVVQLNRKPRTFRKRVDDEKWNHKLLQLRAFSEEHGHCRLVRLEGPLRHWGDRLRKEYPIFQEGKPSFLNADRLAQLQEIGFECRPRQRMTFEDRAKEWLDFKQKHGREPRHVEGEVELRHWTCLVRRRRIKFEAGKKPCSITQANIDLLTSFGFNWETNWDPSAEKKVVKSWEVRFEELVEYKEKHGDCNVNQKQPGLGDFVKRQRKAYKRFKRNQQSFLTPERIKMLKSIGFVFAIRPSRPRNSSAVVASLREECSSSEDEGGYGLQAAVAPWEKYKPHDFR